MDFTKIPFKYDYWSQIKKYLFDHDILSADLDDGKIKRWLNRSYKTPMDDALQSFLPDTELEGWFKHETENFSRFLNRLSKQNTQSVQRNSFYRLLFALNLKNTEGSEANEQANDLFSNYLHLSELSPRNLYEFLIICCLRLELDWYSFSKITKEYVHLLDEQPLAPDLIYENDAQYNRLLESITFSSRSLDDFAAYTVLFFRNSCRQIHTVEDLHEFLHNPENITFFAKTRNTPYLAFFDDIFIEKNDGGELRFIDDLNRNGRVNTLPLTEHHQKVFSMASISGDVWDDAIPANLLTSDEISALTELFPDTFVSYDVFRLYAERTTNNRNQTSQLNNDIPAGMYLLHLLLSLPSDTEDPEYGIDFTDYEKATEKLNSMMITKCFPALSPFNAFDYLVLETLNDTTEIETSDADVSDSEASTTDHKPSLPTIIRREFWDDSETVRRKFLYNLRSNLKYLAADK